MFQHSPLSHQVRRVTGSKLARNSGALEENGLPWPASQADAPVGTERKEEHWPLRVLIVRFFKIWISDGKASMSTESFTVGTQFFCAMQIADTGNLNLPSG